MKKPIVYRNVCWICKSRAVQQCAKRVGLGNFYRISIHTLAKIAPHGREWPFRSFFKFNTRTSNFLKWRWRGPECACAEFRLIPVEEFTPTRRAHCNRIALQDFVWGWGSDSLRFGGCSTCCRRCARRPSQFCYQSEFRFIDIGGDCTYWLWIKMLFHMLIMFTSDSKRFSIFRM